MPKKRRHVRSFWANGKRWALKTAKNLRFNGERVWGRFCPTDMTVWVDSQAKEETLLDTRIHEFDHAFFDGGRQHLLHEDTIDRHATDLMRYLWRLGYRCPSDEDWGE